MAELPMSDRIDVVLPDPPAALLDALAAAGSDRDAIAAVVASDPEFLAGWAAMAKQGREPLERYAYARVGYHRGLDALRRNAWGGTGLCRWVHPGNRGLLTCLELLRRAAAEIGEQPEVTRLADFLVQLDPAWDDANVS